VGALGIDIDPSRAGYLGHGRSARCDHRSPTSHTFQDRQTKALEPRREEQQTSLAIDRGHPVTVNIIEVDDAIPYRRGLELRADRLGAPPPTSNDHQLARVAPIGEEGERPKDTDDVLPRLDGGNKEQIVLRQRGIGLRVIGNGGKMRVEPLVDGVNPAPVDVEVIDEISGRRLRNRDDPGGPTKRLRERQRPDRAP